MRPKVMLFDEVTSALDPELVGEVLSVIRQLGAEHNLTMLMVTHQMGFAREFADRVCFFYAGRIAEQGPPAKLFGNPANERTRQFLSAVLEAGGGIPGIARPGDAAPAISCRWTWAGSAASRPLSRSRRWRAPGARAARSPVPDGAVRPNASLPAQRPHPREHRRRLTHRPRRARGADPNRGRLVHPPDRPGHGIVFDRAALAAHAVEG